MITEHCILHTLDTEVHLQIFTLLISPGRVCMQVLVFLLCSTVTFTHVNLFFPTVELSVTLSMVLTSIGDP